ncbi:NVEALA domain-containing protein [Bacteroides hominis]|uniref:NVEALA domain-containing protein n=1 Tax=Bacteroides hominis TaxID=2763023 RepID=UPI003D6B98A0
MKMKNYLKAAFLLVAIVSVWVLKPTEKSQDVDPLLLQNVEALASGEDPSQTHCYGRGSVDCPVSHDKVDVVYDSYSIGK